MVSAENEVWKVKLQTLPTCWTIAWQRPTGFGCQPASLLAPYPKAEERLIRAAQRLTLITAQPREQTVSFSHLGFGLSTTKECVLGLEIKSKLHALEDDAFQSCFASLNNAQ